MEDMKTTLMVHTHDIGMDDAYVQWIADIKNHFKNAQIIYRRRSKLNNR